MLVLKKLPSNNYRRFRAYPDNSDDIDGENNGDYISYNGTGTHCWVLQAVPNDRWIIISEN